VEDLEQKVRILDEENHRLEIENRNLKEDVGYLATIVRKTPNISNDVLKGVARKPAHSTASAKAAGVCLLLVLFSFGLFFNSKNGSRSLALPFEVEPSEAIPSRSCQASKDTNRLLKSMQHREAIKEESIETSDEISILVENKDARNALLKGKNKRTREDNTPVIGEPMKKQKISPMELETEINNIESKHDCDELGVRIEEDKRNDASISIDGSAELTKQGPRSFIFRSDLIEGDESRTISLYDANSDNLEDSQYTDQLGHLVPIRDAFSDISSLSCQVFNVNIYTQLPTAETI